ncbi:hypothetical protein FGG08_000825 [Glutinoglossum americanum]|uniref:Protein N-terminal glutamine amidohydrolase n=1 Tax=Glutinoglossum americanum TaxID=1670608 RepID=A0A9P8L5U1_9PEZI|nr:hypothetical protein FGG08_000825 [Glutinoglossum americanum]
MEEFVTKVEPLYYTRNYCEENIYRLIRDCLSTQQAVNSTVVFISGKTTDYVPFFCQRSASDRNAPVYWDYHVILVSRICNGPQPFVVVFDLDSALAETRGSAIPFAIYVAMTFYNAGSDPMARSLSTYRIREAPRSFRVIPGMEYLRNFSSDRSHMRKGDAQRMDEEWISPPPPYPPIINEDGLTNTFARYRDFTSRDCELLPIYGRIVDQATFLRKFDMPCVEELVSHPTLGQLPDAGDQGKFKRRRWPPVIDPNAGLQDLQNITRIRSDGQYIVLVCTDCKADRFSNLAHFNEHCRTAHGKEYEDDDERDMACGRVVEKDSSDWNSAEDQQKSQDSPVAFKTIEDLQNIIRLRSDGQYVALVCATCETDLFYDMDDFNHHCRTVHGKKFKDDHEREWTCGRVIDRDVRYWDATEDQESPDAPCIKTSSFASALPGGRSSLKRMKHE